MRRGSTSTGHLSLNLCMVSDKNHCKVLSSDVLSFLVIDMDPSRCMVWLHVFKLAKPRLQTDIAARECLN